MDVPDFDALYRGDPDPWQVATSHYERRKLDLVLACLTRDAYRAAWDPASGTGELAARLSGRAGTVLATDASVEAVRLTAARCADLPNVAVGRIRQPGLPELPTPGFDCLLVAEFAYYLAPDDRAALWAALSAAAAPTAELVLVHWRHRPHDGFLSGRDVNVEALQHLTGSGWYPAVRHDDRDFVLDVVLRDAA